MAYFNSKEIAMTKILSNHPSARLRLERNPEFYHLFVKNFAASGLTLAQYCRHHHVSIETYHNYLLKSSPETTTPDSLHTLSASVKTPPGRMLRVHPIEQENTADLPFQIEFQNGIRLNLAYLDASLLTTLNALPRAPV